MNYQWTLICILLAHIKDYGSKEDNEVLLNILTAARFVIAKKWKKSTPTPCVRNSVKKYGIYQCYSLGNFNFCLILKQGQTRLWSS